MLARWAMVDIEKYKGWCWNTMVDIEDTIVGVENTMVDIENAMVDIENAMVDIVKTNDAMGDVG